MSVNRVKTLSLVGAATAIALPGLLAAAGAPIAYDQWQIADTSGKITIGGGGCGGFSTCSVVASGDGFLQMAGTDGSGDQFFWTIIANEQGSPGGAVGSASAQPFAIESFVKRNSGGGIASRQKQSDSSQGTFISTVSIETGWAATTSGGSNIEFDQSVVVAGELNQKFIFDKQTAVSAGASSSLSSSWVSGDTIAITWIGQDVNLQAGTVAPVSSFSFQSLQVDPVAAGSTTTNSTFEFGANAWDWGSGSDFESEFGAAPSL